MKKVICIALLSIASNAFAASCEDVAELAESIASARDRGVSHEDWKTVAVKYYEPSSGAPVKLLATVLDLDLSPEKTKDFMLRVCLLKRKGTRSVASP